MTPNAALCTLLLALTFAAQGCTTARTAEVPAPPPQESHSMVTVTVSRDQPAYIAAESLSIELLAVTDDRCPDGVTCIWAGHAAVLLKVSKPGAATTTITLGTQAPPHMRLPYDAAYAGYRFHLAQLEPGNTQSPATPYRATVTVSAGAATPPPDSSEM